MRDGLRSGHPEPQFGLEHGQSVEGHAIIALIAIKEGAMSRSLSVRNIDDDLVMRLKRRAARHGRSAEAEHRETLRQALAGEAEPGFNDLAAYDCLYIAAAEAKGLPFVIADDRL